MKDELSVILEEYKSIRTESLSSMEMQQSVLRFGLAAVSALLVVGFSNWNNLVVSGLILLFFVPVLSYLILVVWIGEVARMMRAGLFLRDLERKINAMFAGREELLTWENWLRDSKRYPRAFQFKLSYHAIIALLYLVALASISACSWNLFSQKNTSIVLFIDIGEAIIFIIAFVVVFKIGRELEWTMK